MYYRNVYKIEILSDEPLPDSLTLAEISYEITDGHCSGQVTLTTFNQQTDRETMRQLLIAQGSDPEFLSINDGDEETGS